MTTFKILDSLSQVWDEFTDTTFKNSLHKLSILDSKLKLESRIIGYSEIDKNLLYKSLSDPDELEGLFTKLRIKKEFNRVTEVFNTILLLNKLEFIEGGINDRFRVKTSLSLTRFCKLNNIKETEFLKEF